MLFSFVYLLILGSIFCVEAGDSKLSVVFEVEGETPSSDAKASGAEEDDVLPGGGSAPISLAGTLQEDWSASVVPGTFPGDGSTSIALATAEGWGSEPILASTRPEGEGIPHIGVAKGWVTAHITPRLLEEGETVPKVRGSELEEWSACPVCGSGVEEEKEGSLRFRGNSDLVDDEFPGEVRDLSAVSEECDESAKMDARLISLGKVIVGTLHLPSDLHELGALLSDKKFINELKMVRLALMGNIPGISKQFAESIESKDHSFGRFCESLGGYFYFRNENFRLGHHELDRKKITREYALWLAYELNEYRKEWRPIEGRKEMDGRVFQAIYRQHGPLISILGLEHHLRHFTPTQPPRQHGLLRFFGCFRRRR